MNIFTKIKRDHDEARDMMNTILETPDADARLELYEELKIAILSHAKSEEKTFYQALKQNKEWAEEVPHMKKEHKEVEDLFKEIDGLDAESAMWWEKFGEVRQALLHHMDEEEKEVFKEVKPEMPAMESEELGQLMDELEERVKVTLEAA